MFGWFRRLRERREYRRFLRRDDKAKRQADAVIAELRRSAQARRDGEQSRVRRMDIPGKNPALRTRHARRGR